VQGFSRLHLLQGHGEPLISPEKQKQFRMGVGMLLYLVKYFRPDISNSVRELSKVADGATEGHFKAHLRTIKYVLGTEDHGLLLQQKFNNYGFYLEGISDSEYTRDPDTQISAYSYVLYFLVHLKHENPKLGGASPYYLLKLSTMPLQRYQRK
jgi:hypothetical protein